MLKLLKWDAICFIRRYAWALFGFIAVILMAVIPINGVGFFSAVVIDLCAGLGLFFYLFWLYLAAETSFNWLDKDSTQLELSLPMPVWQRLLSKLTLVIGTNLLASLLFFQLFLIFGKYSSGMITLPTLDNIKTILILALALTMIDITVLFSYLLAKSFHTSRLGSSLLTALLSLVILSIIFIACMLWMAMSNAIVLPSVSSNNMLTIDGTLWINSFTIPVVLMLVVLILEFTGSSYLLEYKFQP